VTRLFVPCRLLVCASLELRNSTQTLSTLRFAKRAKA
jgi:hypothetical protein